MISSNLEWAFGTVGCFSGNIVTDFFLNSFLKVIKSLWLFVQKWWNSVFFQNFNTYQDVSDLHIHPSVVNCIHMIVRMIQRTYTMEFYRFGSFSPTNQDTLCLLHWFYLNLEIITLTVVLQTKNLSSHWLGAKILKMFFPSFFLNPLLSRFNQ